MTRIASFTIDGKPGYGAIRDTGVVHLSARHGAQWPSLREVIEAGALARLAEESSRLAIDLPLDAIRYAIPVPAPEKIICVGVNFPDRNAEYKDGQAAQTNPSLFVRLPRSFVGHDMPLIRPRESNQLDYEGEIAIVIGRSNIVGKPMAHLLTQANATVTVCHSKTRDLREHTLKADLVVVAAGQPEFVGAGDFKKDAVVIDVGIHRKPGKDGKSKLCGDVRLKELEGVIKAGTPVPGGVGPMTITMLMENTVRLAQARAKK